MAQQRIRQCEKCGQELPLSGKPGRPRRYCQSCKPRYNPVDRTNESQACAQCGQELIRENRCGRKRKYCSYICKKAAIAENARARRGSRLVSHEVTCATCGAIFIAPNRRHKYCSKECSRKKERERYKAKYGTSSTHAARGPFSCHCCGKGYYTRRPKGEGEKYCSRSCAFKDQSTWHGNRLDVCWLPEYSRVFFPMCSECGSRFSSTRRSTVVCSDECKATRASRITRDRSKEKHIAKQVVCAECGNEFMTEYGSPRKSYCSDRCSKRNSRRIRRGKERARLRSAQVEAVNPIVVMERDGWRCQICGKQTPRNRRGTRYSNAPELDHRVPLSVGGQHSYANTQCACRACNLEKGNSSSVGQLPLVVG